MARRLVYFRPRQCPLDRVVEVGRARHRHDRRRNGGDRHREGEAPGVGLVARHHARDGEHRLPANVFVIGPEHTANSYALAEHCDAALIYSTKMGIELASLGIPVIVAGEAWIRGKGFSHDASSAEEYRRCLDQLPFRQRLDDATRERALRYAYHFFSRRMIPISTIDPASRWPLCRLRAKGLDAFQPGADKGLDVICDGILNKTPFIFPAERGTA